MANYFGSFHMIPSNIRFHEISKYNLTIMTRRLQKQMISSRFHFIAEIVILRTCKLNHLLG